MLLLPLLVVALGQDPLTELQDSTLAVPRPEADALPPASDGITKAELEHHVRFLASDELMGRPAVSEHSRRVARYLAAALHRSGWEGALEGGGMLQEVPYRRTAFASPHKLSIVTADGSTQDVTMGAEFDLRIRGDVRSGEFEVRHVRGAEDVPAADASLALVVHGSPMRARRWIPDYGEGFGLVLVAGGQKLREGRGLPRPSLELMMGEAAPDLPEEIRLYGTVANEAAKQAARVVLKVDGGPEVVTDPNVVARLKGVGTPEHPELASEVVVISAHFDHVGTSKDPSLAESGEDVIRNGADDDASGVAAVLEIAQALAAGPPPARTVVVLLATAEEIGIEGTKFFVENPPVPLEQIVCNLNFEMIGRPDPEVGGSGKLWLTGFERSSLGPAFSKAGLDLKPDARPEQNFFRRSDNIVFVVKGIVGQTLSSYNMHGDYHQVTDEADRIDFDHMLAATQACLRAVRMLSDGRLTPEWNPGEPKGFRAQDR